MAKGDDERGFFGTIVHAIRQNLAGDDEEDDDSERAVPPSQRRNKLPTDPAARFESSHWGVKPNRRWHDPDFNGELVEMGKLIELWVDGKPLVKFPKSRQGDRPPILAFTTDTAERLYISLPAELKRENARHLIDPRGEWVSLTMVAREAGGRQARWDYPALEVQVLGDCTHVVYATNKKGDGPSEYVHRFSEEDTAQSFVPILCISRDGRLWLAGGSYSVPDPGITD